MWCRALLDRDAERDADPEADFAWMVVFAGPDFVPSDLIVTEEKGRRSPVWPGAIENKREKTEVCTLRKGLGPMVER